MGQVFQLKIKPTIQVFRGKNNVYFRTCGYVTEFEDGTGIICWLCDRMDGSRAVEFLANELKNNGKDKSTETICDIISALNFPRQTV